MATNTAAPLPPTRQDPRQVTNTLKKTINWNDPGVTNAGVQSNIAFDQSIPQSAVLLQCLVEIVTVFNGTTPLLTVGTVSTAYNNIVNAGDVNELAVGVTVVSRGLGQSLFAAGDVTPYVALNMNGATTGQAVITLVYEGGWQS